MLLTANTIAAIDPQVSRTRRRRRFRDSRLRRHVVRRPQLVLLFYSLRRFETSPAGSAARGRGQGCRLDHHDAARRHVLLAGLGARSCRGGQCPLLSVSRWSAASTHSSLLLHGAAGDHRVLVRLGYGQVVLADHVHLPHGAVPGLAERRLALQVWHVEGAHPGQALGQRVVLPRSTTDNWLEFLIHDTIQSADLHTSGGLSW